MRVLVVVLATAYAASLTAAQSPPPEWAPRIAGAHMLWSPEGDGGIPANHLPIVGNGFVGTTINSSAMYVHGHVPVCGTWVWVGARHTKNRCVPVEACRLLPAVPTRCVSCGGWLSLCISHPRVFVENAPGTWPVFTTAT